MRWSVHSRRASNVYKTIKVIIDHVMEQLAGLYSIHGLVTDPEHLHPRSLCGNVLVAPSYVIVELKACNCLAASVDLHKFGARELSNPPVKAAS
jgi:hypothetical protein